MVEGLEVFTTICNLKNSNKETDFVLHCIENLVRFHFKQSRNEGEAGVNAKVFHTLPQERKTFMNHAPNSGSERCQVPRDARYVRDVQS